MKDYKDLKKELIEIAKILKEYPESLQKDVFDILSSAFLGNDFTLQNPLAVKTKKEVKHIPTPPKRKTTNQSSSTKSKRSSSKESYSIVKSLNLKGDKKKVPSLIDFCSDKDKGSAIKFNVLAVYYLKKFLKIEKVSIHHLYTCYKEVGQRVPVALKQSLWDTASSKYGYLDTSDTEDIKIPTSGENYVEYDLIKKTASK